jgi:hypothetical protein
MRPEIILMKRVLLLAASALVLTALVPEPADAQGRRFGVRAGVVRGPAIARRGPVYGYGYGYRRGYRPGVGAAVGLGLLGGAALGAAAAAPYYGYGYGYADPCLRQQQVVDAWGNVRWAYVRVC